jgi:hypothetical protein
MLPEPPVHPNIENCIYMIWQYYTAGPGEDMNDTNPSTSQMIHLYSILNPQHPCASIPSIHGKPPIYK